MNVCKFYSIVNNCKNLEILDVSGCTKVTNLTVTAAIEGSSKKGGKKLKIFAGGQFVEHMILFF